MVVPRYADPVGIPPLRPDSHRGLWFERFFDGYDSHWEIPDDGKRNWIESCAGAAGQREYLWSAALRQRRLVASRHGDSRVLKTTWHFTTGLGIPHPIENGIAWHPTLGVPFLCGAAVKGLLRAWFHAWGDAPSGLDRAAVLDWFGTNDRAGRFIFFDAIPVAPVTLTADVMTPHMNKWYAEGGSIDEKLEEHADRLPADWHDPVPHPFLVVRDARFLFSVAPRRQEWSDQTNAVLESLSEALAQIGAGAKTAAGYGRMELDDASAQRLKDALAEERTAGDRAAALDHLSPLEQMVERLLEGRPDKAQPESTTLFKWLEEGRWSGDDVVAMARIVEAKMRKDGTWEPRSNRRRPSKGHKRTLTVLAYLEGRHP